MTGNQLKDYIDMFQLGNMQVAVCVDGITNIDSINKGLSYTKIDIADNKILLHDNLTSLADITAGQKKTNDKGGSTL